MKYIKRFLISVIILFIMSACSNQTYDNSMEKGIKSLEEKNYARAVSFFEIAVEENEKSQDAKSYLNESTLLNKANDFLTNEDYEQALRSILKIEKLDDVHVVVEKSANDLKKRITQKQQQKIYDEELENIQNLIINQEYNKAESKLETLQNLLAQNPDFTEKLGEASQLLKEAKENQQVTDEKVSKQNEQIAIENTELKKPQQLEENDHFVYNTYVNARYGFSVQYPTVFTEGQAPTNDDGREFFNEESTIVAYGSLINIVAENETIETYYNQTLAELSNSVAYKRLGNNWYVVSYKSGSNTIYQKAIINNGVIYTLQITYPSSQQHNYDSIVSHISNTFTPGE